MDVADAHQRGDVRFVRLRRERIAEEQHGRDAAFGDSAADDQVTAERTVRHSFDRESQLLGQQLAGISSGDQFVLAEEVHVRTDESQMVEADGEWIGETPCSIDVLPSALRVVA